jgi:hypothetical protein
MDKIVEELEKNAEQVANVNPIFAQNPYAAAAASHPTDNSDLRPHTQDEASAAAGQRRKVRQSKRRDSARYSCAQVEEL